MFLFIFYLFQIDCKLHVSVPLFKSQLSRRNHVKSYL